MARSLYAWDMRLTVSPSLPSPPMANRRLHGSQQRGDRGARASQALPLGSSVESNGRRPREERGFQAESTWLHASARTGSSFQLPGGQTASSLPSSSRPHSPLPGSAIPAPFAACASAPLPQPHGFGGEMPVFPPPAHTPVIRQRPQTLTLLGRLGSPIFSLS